MSWAVRAGPRRSYSGLITQAPTQQGLRACPRATPAHRHSAQVCGRSEVSAEKASPTSRGTYSGSTPGQVGPADPCVQKGPAQRCGVAGRVGGREVQGRSGTLNQRRLPRGHRTCGLLLPPLPECPQVEVPAGHGAHVTSPRNLNPGGRDTAVCSPTSTHPETREAVWCRDRNADTLRGTMPTPLSPTLWNGEARRVQGAAHSGRDPSGTHIKCQAGGSGAVSSAQPAAVKWYFKMPTTRSLLQRTTRR